MTPASVSVKETLAFAGPEVPAGADVIVGTGGATVSTVHVAVAGDGSVPALSTARTARVCWPCARLVYASGDVQAPQRPPSRLHWKLAFGSLDVNVKVALVDATAPVGPDVIVVSGSCFCAVNDALTVAEVPPPFEARTENVWVPSAMPVHEDG